MAVQQPQVQCCCRARADIVIASIYVNPTQVSSRLHAAPAVAHSYIARSAMLLQFAAHEDFSVYPASLVRVSTSATLPRATGLHAWEGSPAPTAGRSSGPPFLPVAQHCSLAHPPFQEVPQKGLATENVLATISPS